MLVLHLDPISLKFRLHFLINNTELQFSFFPCSFFEVSGRVSFTCTFKCLNILQEHFLESYIQTLQRKQSVQAVNREELDQLLRELQAFTLASHFFWGLWSVCYASISTIPFDYWVSISLLKVGS
jgi:hypothetical protein